MLSFGTRVAFAFRCFFALLFKGIIPADILERLVPIRIGVDASVPMPPTATADISGAPTEDRGERAVQLLALLQRDGRLVDFLREDIGAYPDAQIGAAVRDVHANCRHVLDRYLPLEAILADDEGQPTIVGASADPAAVKLIGAVGMHASVRGTVRHRGWRVGRIDLPPLPAPAARAIVCPAEVEVA